MFEHRPTIHSADLLYLGPGDRLSIGNDGQGLKGCPGQPRRTGGDQLLHIRGRFGRGAQLKRATHFSQTHPTPLLAQLVLQLVQQAAQNAHAQIRVKSDHHISHALEGDRIGGRKQQTLEDRLEPTGQGRVELLDFMLWNGLLFGSLLAIARLHLSRAGIRRYRIQVLLGDRLVDILPDGRQILLGDRGVYVLSPNGPTYFSRIHAEGVVHSGHGRNVCLLLFFLLRFF